MSADKNTPPLPTSHGALIRWSIHIDGAEHYGAALLDYDDDDRPVWYMAGFEREHTPAQLYTMLLGRDWHEVTR